MNTGPYFFIYKYRIPIRLKVHDDFCEESNVSVRRMGTNYQRYLILILLYRICFYNVCNMSPFRLISQKLRKYFCVIFLYLPLDTLQVPWSVVPGWKLVFDVIGSDLITCNVGIYDIPFMCYNCKRHWYC